MTPPDANPIPAPPKRSDSVDLPGRRLSLTDFLDVETLQNIQDAFAAVTKFTTEIHDADGRSVTQPTDAARRFASDAVLGRLLEDDARLEDGRYLAPITIEGQTLGSIVVTPTHDDDSAAAVNRERLDALAEALDLPEADRARLIESAESAFAANRAAAVQFLYLIANAIARLCYQTYQTQHTLQELAALYRVSTVLSGSGDLQHILDTASRCVAEVMAVDAAVIRMLEEGPDGSELRRRANFGLSESYVNRNRLLVNRSELYSKALSGDAIYIEDLPTDPRTYYPDLARDEGLASMLAVGIIDQGTPIGTLQVYTTQPRRFTKEEVKLSRAVAQLVAAAIAKARLESDRQRNRATTRQLALAADVQRRMLPRRSPALPGIDVAARYVPSYQLSGDFYDFIKLGDDNVGFAVGDVAGKGIAASLLMASVRASLRAYAHDLYHLDQIIRRVNVALTRDTLDNEFATLWYGVIDPQTRRLTYCNAGHEPVLLLREGHIVPLDAGGMIVGVDREQVYDKGVLDLRRGDLILLYTDGLPDAMNADQQRFGRVRIDQLLHELGQRAEPYSAQDAVNFILRRLREHTGPRRGSDDTTLVVIKVDH